MSLLRLYLIAACRLLIVEASFVSEPGLQGARASLVVVPGLRAQAQLLRSTWDLSGSMIEPTSPTLAGRFFTTQPPGKALDLALKMIVNWERLMYNDMGLFNTTCGTVSINVFL